MIFLFDFHEIFTLVFGLHAFLLLLLLLLFLFRIFWRFHVQTEFLIVFFFLNKLVDAQKSFIEFRLCSGPEEMIESKHRFLSYFLSDLGHVFQSHLVDVLGKVPISFDRIEFGLELSVDSRVKLHTIAPGSFPLQKFIMNFSILYFFLSSLDLFNDPLLF